MKHNAATIHYNQRYCFVMIWISKKQYWSIQYESHRKYNENLCVQECVSEEIIWKCGWKSRKFSNYCIAATTTLLHPGFRSKLHDRQFHNLRNSSTFRSNLTQTRVQKCKFIFEEAKKRGQNNLVSFFMSSIRTFASYDLFRVRYTQPQYHVVATHLSTVDMWLKICT